MLPLILGVLGGYFIGDSMNDKAVFAEGGIFKGNSQDKIVKGVEITTYWNAPETLKEIAYNPDELLNIFKKFHKKMYFIDTHFFVTPFNNSGYKFKEIGVEIGGGDFNEIIPQKISKHKLFKYLKGKYGGLDWSNFSSEYAEGGMMEDYEKNLGLVTVKFKNPKYNYSTNVSGSISEEDARKYFVGQYFDKGKYPRENMQKCVDIEFKGKGTYAEGGMMAKGGIVVTSIKDIPNFKKRLDEGKITYRGLGGGKLSSDFYKLTGDSGVRIKVDKKEYYITDKEFDTFSRGADGRMRISFDAPHRKFSDGGVMENGGNIDDLSNEEVEKLYDEIIENIYPDIDIDEMPIMAIEEKREFLKENENYYADGGIMSDDGEIIVGETKIPKDIDEYLRKRAVFIKAQDIAASKLNKIGDKDVRFMGLISDKIRATDEYKKAKMELVKAQKATDDFIASSKKQKEVTKWMGKIKNRMDRMEISRRYSR